MISYTGYYCHTEGRSLVTQGIIVILTGSLVTQGIIVIMRVG